MNTMTNTADFSNQTAQADHSDFFPTLMKKLLGLFCMLSAANSIDQEVLAQHIVLE
jgi:hypothetical protein